MKTFIISSLLVLSFNSWGKCNLSNNTELNQDQINQRALLISAYENQAGKEANLTLINFTEDLKNKFSKVSDELTIKEVASLIIEQDNESNICPNNTLTTMEDLNAAISSRIITIYYGCGCEH